MPFEPGKSGNPEGRRRGRFVHEALVVELKAREKEGDHKGMKMIVSKVVDLAESGERWATEFVRDTLDGRPAQQINLADEDGGPLTVVLKQFVLNGNDRAA